MTRCWNCGSDLQSAPPEAQSDHRVQTDLLRVLEDGWTTLGEYGPLYATADFWILWRVYRLLATGRYALALRQWICERRSFFGIG